MPAMSSVNCRIGPCVGLAWRTRAAVSCSSTRAIRAFTGDGRQNPPARRPPWPAPGHWYSGSRAPPTARRCPAPEQRRLQWCCGRCRCRCHHDALNALGHQRLHHGPACARMAHDNFHTRAIALASDTAAMARDTAFASPCGRTAPDPRRHESRPGTHGRPRRSWARSSVT